MNKSVKINIISENVKLNSYFYEGEGKGNKPTLIWLHGIPGGKEEGKSEFAINLNKAGINVLRFNYQGIWGIKGEFILGNALKDLKAVFDFLTKKENISKYKIDTKKIVTAGYSYGTAVAMIGALYDERIQNIICIALCDYSYLGREFMNPSSKIREFLENAVDGVFSDKKIYKQDPHLFLRNLSDNVAKYDIVRHAERLLHKRILMISGFNDEVCPVEDHLFPVYRRLRELEHKNLTAIIKECNHAPPPDLEKLILKWIKSIK
ncbi:MAG: acetylxylan esterase [Ignavibacteriae bacterium]|nr:acetylxylan esterase [Ignavibacteriota bacterium]